MTNTLSELFDLHDPEIYDCVLWRYSASLSQLYIRLFEPKKDINKHLYLGFRSVLYFSGPTKWTGANFRLGDNDEIKNLIELAQINILDIQPADFSSELRLYIREKTKLAVVILARENAQLINAALNLNV